MRAVAAARGSTRCAHAWHVRLPPVVTAVYSCGMTRSPLSFLSRGAATAIASSASSHSAAETIHVPPAFATDDNLSTHASAFGRKHGNRGANGGVASRALHNEQEDDYATAAAATYTAHTSVAAASDNDAPLPEQDDDDSDDDDERAAWMLGEAPSARSNPYRDMVTSPSRSAPPVPPGLLRSIDGLLKGRNLASLSSHYADMASDMRARNESLLRSVRNMERLAAAREGGVLPTSIPADAANTDSPPLLYGPNETLAYTLHAMLPSYGVAHRIFTELAAQLPPGAAPRTMCDVGSGPGSAVFAARAVWPDTLHDIVCIEPSRSMNQVAEHVLADVPGVVYRRDMADLARFHSGKRFDLVVCHYTLAELPTDRDRAAMLAGMWDVLAPGGVLILSEHGHKWGFHVIKTARDALLRRAATMKRYLPQLLTRGHEGVRRAAAQLEQGEQEAPRAELASIPASDWDSSPAPPAAAASSEAGGSNSITSMSRFKERLPSLADVKKHLKAAKRASGSATALSLRPPTDAAGMAVVGPCPHAQSCPMPSNSWCFFGQNVSRHRRAGRSVHARTQMPMRLEHFSYVALRKISDAHAEEHPRAARVGEETARVWVYDAGERDPADNNRAALEDALHRALDNLREAVDDASRERAQARVDAARAALRAATLVMSRINMEGDDWWLKRRPHKYAPGPVAAMRTGSGSQWEEDSDGEAEQGAAARVNAWQRGQAGSNDEQPQAAASKEVADEEEEDVDAEARTAALETIVAESISTGAAAAGTWARIVRPPLLRNKHTIVDVCTPYGRFERRTVSKGKMRTFPFAYRASRRAAWGGMWPAWIGIPRVYADAAAAIASGVEGGDSDDSASQRPSRKARRKATLQMAYADSATPTEASAVAAATSGSRLMDPAMLATGPAASQRAAAMPRVNVSAMFNRKDPAAAAAAVQQAKAAFEQVDVTKPDAPAAAQAGASSRRRSSSSEAAAAPSAAAAADRQQRGRR